MTEEKKEIKLTQQELMAQYQNARQQVEMLTREINNTRNFLLEMHSTKNALEELENNKKLKIHIGNGIYADAEILETKKVLSALPTGLLIKQTTEKTIKELETRIKETEENAQKISSRHQIETNRLQQIEKIVIQAQQIIKQNAQKKQ
jgi:prefoldin alpha subunit